MDGEMWEGMPTLLPNVDSREDDYQLVRSIGSGSFGQVFLVVHHEEQREYVMKSIELQSASEEGRQQTELEVKLLREMQHPNIVAYRDSFIDRSGHLCIYMEYCEHGDIFNYLEGARRTHSTPDESRLLEWFTQIVLALQSLHLKRILHRDLKTQNIFLTGDRQQGIFAAKLGDFGIAKVLNSTVDLAKTQIGTPFYMSPELINSHPYSYKSDVWGLGCVLYEIVNGQRAFDAQSLNGLALKIIKGSYTPISASCSATAKQLIKAMLSKSPAHRPSLKEILHMPSIRPTIPCAHRSSIAAGPPEARVAIEQTLNDQLAGLGLGGLVNGPEGPRRNKKRLLERLERAKGLQQREEQVLQQTVALLAECLRDPSADDAAFYGSSPSAPSAPRAPPLPAMPPDGSEEDALMPPTLSHRERLMRQKETAPHGMHPEGRRLREPHQPAALPRGVRHAERRHRSTSMEAHEGMAGRRHSSKERSAGRSRARTEEVISPHDQDPQISSVSWLLEYDHVQPENLANPFQQCRQSVVHSPNQRLRPAMRHVKSEPQPPPLPFGEPLPPNSAPPAAASGVRSWRTADGPFKAKTPIHTVYLEALEVPRQRSHYSDAEGFEDVLSSGSSLTEVDEFGDVAVPQDGMDSDGYHARQRSLQERIDESKAAICKYRMTIDMLQYSFEHGEDVLVTDRSVRAPPAPPAPPPHDAMGGLYGPGKTDEAHPPMAGTRHHMPAPGVVQDCSARLHRRCLEGLGSEMLQVVRRAVQQSLDAAELPSSLRLRMLDLLGSEKIGFLALIDQLVHMERCWGTQDPG